MQTILGNEIPFDKTNYFTEVNHPGILLENKEKSIIIFKAINSLPESQKVIFTLAKIDGKSYQEIVEITGKSLSSVESIMFRAKKGLQQKLENFYKNEG
jgi:RNA polymerase sigma-70 factor (ECF subfamily)